jgi:hypothetical protein
MMILDRTCDGGVPLQAATPSMPPCSSHDPQIWGRKNRRLAFGSLRRLLKVPAFLGGHVVRFAYSYILSLHYILFRLQLLFAVR